jgi:hypothetical protein
MADFINSTTLDVRLSVNTPEYTAPWVTPVDLSQVSGVAHKYWKWDGGASQSFRVQIAVVSWDRPRLLEDVARTFAEHGTNIVEYGGHVEDQMAKNWYVAEIGDVKALRAILNALRNVESVFDAIASPCPDAGGEAAKLREPGSGPSERTPWSQLTSLYAAVEELRGRAELGSLRRCPNGTGGRGSPQADLRCRPFGSREGWGRALRGRRGQLADARRRSSPATRPVAERSLLRRGVGGAGGARAAASEICWTRAHAGGPRPPAGSPARQWARPGHERVGSGDAPEPRLVARSQLAAERDGIVRQAHELAAVVLGEALPPLGAREVVRQVEEQLAPK